MKNKNILSFFLIVFLVLVLTPFFSLAEGPLEVVYPTLSSGVTINQQSELTHYLKYLFDIGIFIGFFVAVLSLIFAGILYFLSPAIPSAYAMAKDRISGVISGVLILALLYLIIVTVNPYLAIFKLGKLDPVELPLDPPPPAGAYFYEEQGCPGKESIFSTSSISDFGDKKNKINSAKITQGTTNDNKYISIVYETPNFWGMCDYVNPNTTCHSFMAPFGSSASVHRYNYNPSGDVVFYRKSFYEKEGGFLKIEASQIKNQPGHDLTKLRFTGTINSSKCTVPEEEQDCIEWNKDKECIKRECPNLSGENITSIEIKGGYIVILVYSDETSRTSSIKNFCQEFPTPSDANKQGPIQIKWENVKQQSGMPPNYVYIIPVHNK
jgi:hypothetical protein